VIKVQAYQSMKLWQHISNCVRLVLTLEVTQFANIKATKARSKCGGDFYLGNEHRARWDFGVLPELQVLQEQKRIVQIACAVYPETQVGHWLPW
jgi:hypothetical protein